VFDAKRTCVSAVFRFFGRPVFEAAKKLSFSSPMLFEFRPPRRGSPALSWTRSCR
jgi:hypothetical protein